MEDFSTYVRRILRQYKRMETADYLICIPVYQDDGEIVAYLRPITADFRKTIPQCVALLSQWRVENPSIATGTFTVTHERTMKWLDNLVVNNDDRILFMIQALDANYLGHIGFAAFDETDRSAEIDSVLRGVKDASPGLMQAAMKAIMAWGQKELGLAAIHLKVFHDNPHAICFYERCGFEDAGRIPLVKVVLPDEEKWEISEDPNMTDAERYYVKMDYKR